MLDIISACVILKGIAIWLRGHEIANLKSGHFCWKWQSIMEMFWLKLSHKEHKFINTAQVNLLSATMLSACNTKPCHRWSPVVDNQVFLGGPVCTTCRALCCSAGPALTFSNPSTFSPTQLPSNHYGDNRSSWIWPKKSWWCTGNEKSRATLEKATTLNFLSWPDFLRLQCSIAVQCTSTLIKLLEQVHSIIWVFTATALQTM